MQPPVLPLFDSIQYINSSNAFVNNHVANLSFSSLEDASLIIEHAMDWLMEQRNHENNYKAYRSELTTFLHWIFDCYKKNVSELSRKDISKYVAYCQSPPINLIGYFNVSQFITDENGERIPNEKWRPFIGKKEFGEILPYQLSDNALKTKLAILSAFYTFLMGEDYCEKNPAQVWMNHSRFSSKKKYALNLDEDEVKAFTELQWSYVVSSAMDLAKSNPESHQRSLFLIRLLYGCYLRISEIGARAGYSPVMGQFKQSNETGIWFFHIPKSKGGKKRNVAVSKELLSGLKEYRLFLGLPEMPVSDEKTPLLIRHKQASRGRDIGKLNANLGIRQLRDEVQFVINNAADEAMKDGLINDSHAIRRLTAHAIRHTGITHDININNRPLSHVQADAGHDSIDTTSRYLYTSINERHESAANKALDSLSSIYK